MSLGLNAPNSTALTVGVVAGTILAFFLLIRSFKKRIWIPVAIVSKLYLYPVKSCQGIMVDAVQSERHGLRSKSLQVRDRSFILCYSNGQMITGRQQPSLVLVKLEIKNGVIQITAPNMESIELHPSKYKQSPLVKLR